MESHLLHGLEESDFGRVRNSAITGMALKTNPLDSRKFSNGRGKFEPRRRGKGMRKRERIKNC